VLDEHGGVAGVVSIRDILEQLVGDLNDEFDEDDEPTIVRIREDRWLVDGQTHVDRVEEELGLEIPKASTSPSPVSSSTWPVKSLCGTTFAFGDWTFRVQSVEKRRISELLSSFILHRASGRGIDLAFETLSFNE